MNLETFVDSYDGPRLSLIFTGCGAHAASLLLVPGASKVLHDIQIPYAHEAVEALVGQLSTPAVSKERVLALHARSCPEGVLRVTVTAAITSRRYRRGDNHAYIGVDTTDGTKVYHLTLFKIPDNAHTSTKAVSEARELEDFLICDTALGLATSQPIEVQNMFETHGISLVEV